ncbi:hypothetical protein ACFFHM_02980 [Halalkalibacter kiskunsagensis]|uniref:Intracellular proteinase inhibitor BsuPI domain-containing protein n=1 Tax=Halalkalibacter kiskunsagensis TaxID=1548599 RepID=A0ABV6K8E3_9BACI
MKKYIILPLLLAVLTACGPEVTIEIDEERTHIIFDEEREMISLYIRIINKGELPAKDLYALFLFTDENVQTALGELRELTFSDSHGVPEVFQLNGGSSFL